MSHPGRHARKRGSFAHGFRTTVQRHRRVLLAVTVIFAVVAVAVVAAFTGYIIPAGKNLNPVVDCGRACNYVLPRSTAPVISGQDPLSPALPPVTSPILGPAPPFVTPIAKAHQPDPRPTPTIGR